MLLTICTLAVGSGLTWADGFTSGPLVPSPINRLCALPRLLRWREGSLGLTHVAAQGYRAASALSGSRCDDTAAVATTLSPEVRGPRWGARVELTEFCPSFHTTSGSYKLKCGGQSEGPRLFSKQAGWPTPDGHPQPPSRQSSGPASPGRWEVSIASTKLPAGVGTDSELGFGCTCINVGTRSPLLSLGRTSSGQGFPGWPTRTCGLHLVPQT